jgi:hypothetical protein
MLIAALVLERGRDLVEIDLVQVEHQLRIVADLLLTDGEGRTVRGYLRLISPVLDRAMLRRTGRLGTPRVRRHRLSD